MRFIFHKSDSAGHGLAIALFALSRAGVGNKFNRTNSSLLLLMLETFADNLFNFDRKDSHNDDTMFATPVLATVQQPSDNTRVTFTGLSQHLLVFMSRKICHHIREGGGRKFLENDLRHDGPGHGDGKVMDKRMKASAKMKPNRWWWNSAPGVRQSEELLTS